MPAVVERLVFLGPDTQVMLRLATGPPGFHLVLGRHSGDRVQFVTEPGRAVPKVIQPDRSC